MKSLVEYISNMEVNAEILEMEMEMLASDTIITESFKSSILQKLAKKIYDAEKENNQREIKNKQDKANALSFNLNNIILIFISFNSICYIYFYC